MKDRMHLTQGICEVAVRKTRYQKTQRQRLMSGTGNGYIFNAKFEPNNTLKRSYTEISNQIVSPPCRILVHARNSKSCKFIRAFEAKLTILSNYVPQILI